MPKEEIKKEWIASGYKAVEYCNQSYPEYKTKIVEPNIVVRNGQGTKYYDSVIKAFSSGETSLVLVDNVLFGKKELVIDENKELTLNLARYTYTLLF